MTNYAPLWCKSNFSLLEGASHPEELIERAYQLGLPALALTDTNSVAGAPRAAAKARTLGIHLIYGAEITVKHQRRISLLAYNRPGYANITRLISRIHATHQPPHATINDLCEASQGCFGLIGGDDSWFGAPESICDQEIDALKEAFNGHLLVRISNHQHPIETQRKALLIDRSKRFNLPIVAANEHLYHDANRQPLADVLSCIRANCTLDEAGFNIRRNSHHALESSAAFKQRFLGHPEWLEQSLVIASRCSFDLFSLRYRYPCERLPQGVRGIDHLKQLALTGARKRYHHTIPSKVYDQLTKELNLVEELDYTGYFLTMWEIVHFCQEQGILCQGRGSAANSTLCFCLEITAVDPMKHHLLFERFLSRERSEPPDIDLDIAHERREEVLQYVYKKYGRRHAAMVSVNIRYRMKSALKDSGKAFKIPKKTIKNLVKLSNRSTREIPNSWLETLNLDANNARYTTWLRTAESMIDTPRHRSIHPGGFLLGHEPIDSFVPIMPARMPGRTMIQWDKDDIETLGLFKVDLLGLGMLSQIQRCFDLIRRYPPTHSSLNPNLKDHDLLAHIPADDQATYTMLSKGDSLGVFQVESRAQMNMLPRLKPQCFYDLVVQIAIVRPGPISGEMVHPYLRRRNGLEPVVYPHPTLEPVLSRTLGVPLFQEQVMQIAMVVADYTPGEADQLRRDMAAWKRTGQMQAHQERLTQRMKTKGITPEFAERVYEQIKGFGEYGFPESHATSFALISYATAYLKRHFNAHFYAALINAQPMGFYSLSTLVYGAQREGVDIRPVDIRYANWECSLEPNHDRFAIRMGIKTIKGIGPHQRQFLDPPPRPQNLETLAQYSRRTQLNHTTLKAMAEAGALDLFGSRRQVLWQLLEPGISRFEPLIFEDNQTPNILASLSAMERISWDQRRTAHSTRGHPFELLRATCNQHGFTPSSRLKLCAHQQRVRCVGLVICRQRPSTASGVTFVTLEDESGFINLVIWKDTAERFQAVLKGASVLAASGRVQREQEIIHLIVHRLWLPEWKNTIEPVPSHDYR